MGLSRGNREAGKLGSSSDTQRGGWEEGSCEGVSAPSGTGQGGGKVGVGQDSHPE